MKKIGAIAAALALLLTASGCNNAVQESTYTPPEDTIQIGDYLQLGIYNNEPIVWRCVAIDDNGPLMLSDKILCMKPFDAAGQETSASHGRGYENGKERRAKGSNYWIDSNIRAWLNSTVTDGNIEWPCGNPPEPSAVTHNSYSGEAGFLAGFSEADMTYVKKVMQKAILDGYEKSQTMDENTYKFSSLDDLDANYETALSDSAADKMFLLDTKQLDEVRKNGDVLGYEYYIGAPTQTAVNKSEYKNDLLIGRVNWYYWLRTPVAFDGNSSRVAVVTRNKSIEGFSANDGSIGVRPAFYIQTGKVQFTSGSGRETDPYRLQKVAE